MGLSSERIGTGYNIKYVGTICHQSEGFWHAQGLVVRNAGQRNKNSINTFQTKSTTNKKINVYSTVTDICTYKLNNIQIVVKLSLNIN